MEKRLQPKLRFLEFCEEWSIKKLDDLTQRKSGHTPNKKKSEYYNGGIKWISLKDSSSLDSGRIYESNTEISEEGLKNSSAVLLPAETVIMSRDAGVGKSAILGIPMAVSQHFIAWTPIGKLDPFFLYTYLQKEKKEFERIAVGSTIKTIGLPYFKKYSLIIPPLPEQEKIASFLSCVDNKIENLEKKKGLLGKYKKGIMQKIFSQKTRFKDENGKNYPDWKENKIGDFLVESRIKGDTGDKAHKLTVKLWKKGVFAKNEVAKGSENTQYFIREAGQLIYSKLDFLNCAFAIIPEELDGYQSTIDLPCFDFKKEINKYFFLERITQLNFYKQYGDQANGSRKAKRINPNVFFEMPFFTPCLKEQEKIADFLSIIDKKIEIVNTKIDEMKEFKKGLLQQMFV